MLKSFLRKAAKWTKKVARKAAIIGTAIFALSSPAKAEINQQGPEKEAVTYVVQEGDYLSGIAKERLLESGSDYTMEDIIRETNRIASLNGKATVQEYPFTTENRGSYDCTDAPQEDPNCIYPGQEVVLEQESVTPDSQQQSSNDGLPYGLLALYGGLAAAIIASRSYAKKKDEEEKSNYLENLVEMKNHNPYSSLDKLVGRTDNDLIRDKDDLKRNYQTFFSEYRAGNTPEGLRIEKYDNNIAPEEMKMEMVNKYRESEESLETVARNLSIKYGMNVSRSTVSRYGREAHGVSSRKEAKESKEAKAA